MGAGAVAEPRRASKSKAVTTGGVAANIFRWFVRLGAAAKHILRPTDPVLVIAHSTFFTVYQTRQALVARIGEPVRVITEPGLNAKIPFIDSVSYIDKRILNIECVLSLPHNPAIARLRRLLVPCSLGQSIGIAALSWFEDI